MKKQKMPMSLSLHLSEWEKKTENITQEWRLKEE